VTPYIALEKLNALHIKKYFNGIGHGLVVRRRYLNHSQSKASLHQIEEVSGILGADNISTYGPYQLPGCAAIGMHIATLTRPVCPA
jgi:hypothetical protein